MREYRDRLIAKCKTRESARNAFSMASVFFNYLIDDLDMRLRNPCNGVNVAVDNEDIENALQVEDIYSDEEIELIKTALLTKIEKATAAAERMNSGWSPRVYCELRDRAIVYLCMFCGMRIGEVLALRWSDFDFEAAIVTVNKTLTKRMKIQPGKSVAAKRTLGMADDVIAVLEAFRAFSRHEHFAATESGKPLAYRNMHRKWESIPDAAGVPYQSLHCLRHYFASKLIEAGTISDHELTTMMGHKDINFTRQMYGHLLNRQMRVARNVAQMNTIFGRGNRNSGPS